MICWWKIIIRFGIEGREGENVLSELSGLCSDAEEVWEKGWIFVSRIVKLNCEKMYPQWQARRLEADDQEFLWEMLYTALWDAPDEERRPRSVLENPRIKRLVEGWGRSQDFGIVALDPDSGEEIGAIWARLDGYDQVEGFGCDCPCLGIAVVESFHGKGVGSFLMSRFFGRPSRSMFRASLGSASQKSGGDSAL